MSRSLREMGKVPNTDVGSWDDKRDALPLIQIIIRVGPIHAMAVLEGRGQGGLFARERESIRDGQEPKTKGMFAGSMWTLEKLQLEMQLVKGVNGFVYSVRTGGQIQFGVRVWSDQLGEVRARMLPHDVRYTHENRHIRELQQYTLQPPEIVEMLLECVRKAGVPWLVVRKAPDP